MGRKYAVLVASCLLSSATIGAVSTIRPLALTSRHAHRRDDPTILVRGGATSPSPSKKKTKKSSKNKKPSGKTKRAIDTAMKEKDSAKALGDAIRDRADELRKDDPMIKSIDSSIASVGHAIGATDHRMPEGGGVEAATTSVIANYFLKSHGGIHGLQFLCSILATLSGFGTFLFRSSPLGYTLLQRTMIFAMIKHISGVIAAASIAAKAIPKIGLSNARQWMEQLVLDPVSQYVFYTALVLSWLPSKNKIDSCWWWKKYVSLLMVIGPVLIREIISNIMVFSDLLVLSSVGSESTAIDSILKVSNSIVNAIMSMLVSPKAWRGADASGRQAILAKLVSDASLGLEIGVGALMLLDLVITFTALAFTGGSNRPPLRHLIAKMVCVRLYVHFLWVRRKKISKLAVNVRGGASKVPFWFLDILEHPGQAMGLVESEPNKTQNVDMSTWSWTEYAAAALGLDQ
eukprot:scaffold1474_cov132-Cylindrotheca_fusiformis.AAC.16